MEIGKPSGARTIAILCGGNTPQRGTSLASAQAAALGYAQLGHAPTLIDVAELAADGIEWPAYDVCHFELCDDQEAAPYRQRASAAGIPHIGSDDQTLRLVAHLAAAREAFLCCDVPTPPFIVLRRGVSPLVAVTRAASLGYPLRIRSDILSAPDATRVVRSSDDLISALQNDFAGEERVVCERYLAGRTFVVTLLSEQVLPPILRPAIEGDDATDAPLLPSQRQQLERAALLAAAAVGTAGLAQFEILLDTAARAWVLDVTTVPSLAEGSFARQAAAQAGLTLVDLCRALLDDALVSESPRPLPAALPMRGTLR